MRKRLAFAALATAVAALFVNHATAQADMKPLVLDGDPVDSAPWAAQVYGAGGSFCSGTIIAPEWVLTAAHCVDEPMKVKVGNVHIGQGEAAEVTKVFKTGDTALLQLDHGIETEYVTLATEDPPIGSENEIYGWGGQDDQLTTGKVEVKEIGDTEDGRTITSISRKGKAWPGDSGGPQFYNGQEVATASAICCDGMQFYQSVAAIRDWIRDTSGV